MKAKSVDSEGSNDSPSSSGRSVSSGGTNENDRCGRFRHHHIRYAFGLKSK
ncbi:hypothetical protein [Clostridium thermosuccinogenes]|uniref:hypothetical protein n=1 Tax=Clostridium thermosuccinogenes TaxID=84032 RepID=UPI0013749D0A|nr:hypothetical protein [Pseudoclostridium thermosuccinogenes]